MKRTVSLVLVLLATVLLSSRVAQAQYPEKPVQFIVPWPPGVLEDVLTRMIAEEMQPQTGVAAAVVPIVLGVVLGRILDARFSRQPRQGRDAVGFH